MTGFPEKFKGTAKLEASEGFLKGSFQLGTALQTPMNATFHVHNRGVEIKWEIPAQTGETAPNLVNRLFKWVGAKPETKGTPQSIRLNSPHLAQAFRDEDSVVFECDPSQNEIAIACIRQGQLAFSVGQIAALLPLKGAANLIFESMAHNQDSNSPGSPLVLRTSLRTLELKPGKVIALGYYNVAAWNAVELAQSQFVSIIRSGVSLTTEDLRRITRDWKLTKPLLESTSSSN